MSRHVPTGLAVLALASWVAAPSAAQAPRPVAKPAAAPESWKQTRTPWGHPDLQGAWTSDSARGIPRERPEQFAGRAQLTDQEFAERVAGDEQTIKNALNASGVQTGGRDERGAAASRSGKRHS